MHSFRPLLCLAFAGALIACKKEEAPPAAPPVEDSHAAQVTPTAGEESLASAPAKTESEATPDQSKRDSKLADLGAEPAAVPPTGEAETKVAGEETVAEPEAVKAEEEKPAEEKPATDKKKKGDKDSKDKAAEPAKEEKPKFTELAVKVTKAGTGATATAGSRVLLHYRASLVDATEPFDSTYAVRRPIEVDLGAAAKLQVIEGLRRGLEGLSAGSEARLEIPASLAWAEKGAPGAGVPPNSDVVFEIQVLDVQ